MPAINPDHLFDQADKLITHRPAGPPRQVDLRRAISTAYYGVFHAILTSVADEFVGVTQRNTKIYTLAYRSVDHRALRDLCNEATKQQPSTRCQKSMPLNGFGPDIRVFANALVDLQEQRHSADYDPSIRVRLLDARLAIATARSAVQRYRQASSNQRKTFSALLLFPPR